MLHGFITERDLRAIEETFPGIWEYYLALKDKPCTFLDLMWRFSRRCEPARPARAAGPVQLENTPQS
jgi:hypothetical protein